MYTDALADAISTPPEVNPSACPGPRAADDGHALDGVYHIMGQVTGAPHLFFAARRTRFGVELTLAGGRRSFQFTDAFLADLEAGRIAEVEGDAQNLMERITTEEAHQLHRRLGGAGWSGSKEHYELCSERYGRPISSLTQLTRAEKEDLHEWLDGESKEEERTGREALPQRPRVPLSERTVAPGKRHVGA